MDSITTTHIERGRQMKALVSDDIRRGVGFETALTNLADYLEIEVASVRLALAIANAADRGKLVADGRGGFVLGNHGAVA